MPLCTPLGGMEIKLHQFFTMALEDQWPASCLQHLSPGKRAPSAHSAAGWVGPRAHLDMLGNRKTPSPFGNLTMIPCSSSPQHRHYITYAIPVFRQKRSQRIGRMDKNCVTPVYDTWRQKTSYVYNHFTPLFLYIMFKTCVFWTFIIVLLF